MEEVEWIDTLIKIHLATPNPSGIHHGVMANRNAVQLTHRVEIISLFFAC